MREKISRLRGSQAGEGTERSRYGHQYIGEEKRYAQVKRQSR